MKTFLFGLLLSILLILSPSVRSEELETIVSPWAVADSTTSSGTEPSALDCAANECTYSGVIAAIAAAASGDDEISIVQIPADTVTKVNGIRVRCLGSADAGSVTYNVYTGTLHNNSDCDLTFAGTLAFTIGTQDSFITGYLYADTLAVTEGDTTADWSYESPANNRIAEASIDLQGDDLIVLVPTTASVDCKLLLKYL